ncbi:MAG TPA: hypothetical protein VJH69_02835 [Candidatus Paceibacterota bacterium]
MLPYRDSRIVRIILIAFFVLIIIYAYYEAQGLLYGPIIDVPAEVPVVSEPFIYVEGTAGRISQLTMNGKPISVTETGEFREPYLLAVGNNRIILKASDKYGRSREKTIDILFMPASTPPPDTMSTTTVTN